MKILELQRILPRLNESARDIDSLVEFTRIMSLAEINNPKKNKHMGYRMCRWKVKKDFTRITHQERRRK